MANLHNPRESRNLAPFGLMAGGMVLVVLAWLLPVNFKSVNATLLRAAGKGTVSTVGLGLALIEAEKPGPAEMVLAAAESYQDGAAPQLSQAVEKFLTRQPDFAPWGGWDPALEPLVTAGVAAKVNSSQPILTFLIAEKARAIVRVALAKARSPGVQALLNTRELTTTTQFIPATQAGGQPLDAVILLSALLYQGERFSPGLQRDVKGLADAALVTQNTQDLEVFYLDLLTLGKRLDWIQLGELLRSAETTTTVHQFAHLARIAPENLPVIYTAALASKSSDHVALYLLTYGKPGVEWLRQALREGQGALQVLLDRQVPVASEGPALEGMATFALLHPAVALTLKYAGFFVGAWLILVGLNLHLFSTPVAGARADTQALPRIKSGVIALLFSLVLITLTEPFLLRGTPPSDYKIHLVLPVLSLTSSTPVTSKTASSLPAMENTTLLSVALFALLQTLMYVVCLLKIKEINRQPLPALVKLKLMENEENLFDGGLYIGIAGTASALVLQVLGLIPANLLAAYASNLFGIICVALVKIRHVRPYKRQLIVDSQVVPSVVS